MLEVEIYQMLIAAKHLIAELLLRQVEHALIRDYRIIATTSLTIELSYGLTSTKIAPPLYDIWRMVYILHSEIGLVCETLESLEMIVLITQPPWIYLP
jgi:hypothetical protein